MAFSGSPRVLRGAIIGIDPANPLASVVVFQYNPASLSRTLQPKLTGGQGSNRSEPLRLAGPPVESITVGVEIDATDQLEKTDPLAVAMGIYPQLSALEMLIYPKSATVIANTVLLAAGTIEVIPPLAPLTLFIWGPARVVPVRLTSFTITEEEYDVILNPIRAKVDLGLQVLSTNDLPVTDPGYAIFLVHQVMKEVMATVGSVAGIAGSASASVDVSIGG